MDTTDVTVPVPSDRVPEFYRWYADWVEGSADEGVRSAPVEESLDAAVRWWTLLKPREREIFGLWIDEAPTMHSAATIVEKLGLNGQREIPGILSWPRRKGEKVGFDVKWNFRRDAVTEEPLYGIEDEEYAALIRDARAALQKG